MIRTLEVPESATAPVSDYSLTTIGSVYGLIPLSRSGWTATATSYYSGSWLPSNTIDGNTSTAWHSDATTLPQSLYIDMCSAQTFNAVSYLPRQDFDDHPIQVNVYVGDDGATWGTAVATA